MLLQNYLDTREEFQNLIDSEILRLTAIEDEKRKKNERTTKRAKKEGVEPELLKIYNISKACLSSAALFAAATEVSPVIAGRPAKERTALRDYGLKLGLAFQLVDDALDYGGFESALGKSVGDDFREGKMTLPVIRAVEAADKTEAEFWHRVIVEREQTEVDFETAISLLRKTGALDSTMDLARQYAREAREALSIFEVSPWRETLEDLADYVVERIN